MTKKPFSDNYDEPEPEYEYDPTEEFGGDYYLPEDEEGSVDIHDQEIEQIGEFGEVIFTFVSPQAAQKITGIDTSSIIKVCNGEADLAGGFSWQWKSV